MCILIIKPKGVVLPDYSTLCRCARRNPHGFGFATPEKIFKTLDFNKFIKALSETDDDMPMMIHFRLATHGSIKPSNCHPFRDDSNGLIFAHNGVMNIATLPDKTDSETAFKLLLSPSYDRYGFGSSKFRYAVDSIRGDSRFGFMDSDGEIHAFGRFYDSDCKVRSGSFVAKNKVYFSNQGFY